MPNKNRGLTGYGISCEAAELRIQGNDGPTNRFQGWVILKDTGHHADNLVGFAIQGDAPPDHSWIRAEAIDPHRVTDYDHMRRAGFIVAGFARASEMRGRSKRLEELVMNLARGDQFGSLVI
jgi:hypothetical protein